MVNVGEKYPVVLCVFRGDVSGACHVPRHIHVNAEEAGGDAGWDGYFQRFNRRAIIHDNQFQIILHALRQLG